MLEDVLAESSTDLMSDDQIREFLLEQGVGVLALAGAGVPYVLPMSFGYDGGRTLYFRFLLFGDETRKETLSDRAGRASFTTYSVESKFEWRSVILTGELRAVPDSERDALREATENAWHPNLFSSATPKRGIEGYRLDVDEWTGIWNRSSPRDSSVTHTF
jgi:nitroimidazol reductase NimA-like FMN-containing flavoprotein (pyridoxamine 5'-phosphate oxidase superfamily)